MANNGPAIGKTHPAFADCASAKMVAAAPEHDQARRVSKA